MTDCDLILSYPVTYYRNMDYTLKILLWNGYFYFPSPIGEFHPDNIVILFK